MLPVHLKLALRGGACSIAHVAAILFFCSLSRTCLALENGLARLPFQGWNSWNVRHFLNVLGDACAWLSERCFLYTQTALPARLSC